MKPTLQAILVADHVYTDCPTNKKIVTGIFHQIHRRQLSKKVGGAEGTVDIEVPSSGVRSGSPFCYISLTNVRGKTPLSLRYVDLSDDRLVFELKFEVDSGDPIGVVEVVCGLLPLPSDKAAAYALELTYNDEPLGAYRINVLIDES